MIFIGRADGVLRKNERAIIIKYIALKAGVQVNEELLDKEIKIMNCLVDDFRKKVKIIAKNRDKQDKLELINYIDQIIRVDKIVDSLEMAGLEVICNIFNNDTISK